MASRRSTRENLVWAGTLALGTWLSIRMARWLAGSMASPGPASRPSAPEEPVREIVEEVLSEHRAEDTPMVHAFEEALGTEEETRERAP